MLVLRSSSESRWYGVSPGTRRLLLHLGSSHGALVGQTRGGSGRRLLKRRRGRVGNLALSRCQLCQKTRGESSLHGTDLSRTTYHGLCIITGVIIVITVKIIVTIVVIVAITDIDSGRSL